MAAREVTFSPESALESVLFILRALGGKGTVHEVLKIRYFADKAHLADYGWLASGDRYCALQFGPVPSRLYNLLKAAHGESSEFIPPLFAKLTEGALEASQYPTLRPLREPDESRLSRADVQSLIRAIEQCSGWSFNRRTGASHDEAWKQARARWEHNGDPEMSVEEIASTLPNAQEVREHLASA